MMVGDERQHCLKCKNKIEGECYQCDICHEKIHVGCSNLSASEVKCMPLQKRLLIFSCDSCKEVLKKIPTLVTLLEDVKHHLASMNSSNSQCPVSTQKYSEVIKKKQEVIVIKPKDKNKGSSSTKKAIEEQIDPKSIGAEVSKIKFVREGGIAISCTGRDDITNISNSIRDKMSRDYEIKVPEKKNPRLKITNIEKKLMQNYDTLIESIILQNGITTEENQRVMKVLSTYEDRRRKLNVAIVEVDEVTYSQISRRDVLHIGWRRCRYFDHVNIIQCFKCWKFGHIAQQCKNREVICPKCSQNHKKEECTSEVEICTNCKHAKEVLKIANIDYHHSAYNRKCEAFKRLFEQLQLRVSYPDVFQQSTK